MYSLRRVTFKNDLIKNTLLRLHSTSIETASKQTGPYDSDLKQYERLTNLTKRTRQKKPQRPPFVKNLLLGKFDTEILVFPQLENEECDYLTRDTGNLKTLLKQKHMVNVNSMGDKNFRQSLSDIQSIGLQASQFLDGRESTPMEVMKFLETYADHDLGNNLIYNEQLSVQTLVKYASEALQKKYLFPVIKGEKLLAFCLNDKEFSTLSSMKTKAELTEDGKYWILNGEKMYVVNGVSADYLIVFAVTNISNNEESSDVSITAFLVEKDVQGVSWRKIDGSRNEVAQISFQNVQIPVENIIGQVHKADHIAKDIISDFRLSCGAACSTLSRNMINNLLQTILKESVEDPVLYKSESVRNKLGKMAMNLYAAESITYLTAGLQDWYDNQDVTIESAIVKVLTSEVAYEIAKICLESVGISANFKDHWSRKYHDRVLDYLTLYETNESQKLFIALMGLQYAGVKLSEKIKKLRNPLFHGTFALSRIWTNRKNVFDNPDLNLNLSYFLHPSLQQASLHLEYCAKRLEYGTEMILTKHGLEVMNKHVDLYRLADVMIDCYAMTAVLARASRSHCIGLRNSPFELLLASNFCYFARMRVKNNILRYYYVEDLNSDKNLYDIGKQMTKSREYIIQEALMRNF
ncbi:acyl-CoA dehydrogenase family member enigma [Rhynchophorus ferrugineus]|uniref:acyl-CoA dehydrogenase family member enigma n=1 Tax=Rhynchophorus ferrugineus TaxID=354439 RepID=UPI003FCE196D